MNNELNTIYVDIVTGVAIPAENMFTNKYSFTVSIRGLLVQ